MPENDKEKTAPATLDAAAVKALIAESNKGFAETLAAIQANQKVIADTMAADAKSKADADAVKADATKSDAAKKPAEALTAEAIQKLVADGIATAAKQQADAAKGTLARDAFISEKLKGVPAAYHGRLGADPTKWAAEEQSIREGLKADLTAMGLTPKDVGGGDPGGTANSGGGNATEKLGQYKAYGLTDGQAEFATGIVLPT